MNRSFARSTLIAPLLLLMLVSLPVQADTDALWRALGSGGHLVIMRHALAPGTGDPPQFDVSDCATQRNLSGEGRRQARLIGDRFRANGIGAAAVFTSQWCRCRETAELLGLGEVDDLPAINSFFQNFSLREPQTLALRQWLDQQPLDRPLVLVTHQVNINAFTDRFTRSGEMVFLRRVGKGDYRVVGTIETD